MLNIRTFIKAATGANVWLRYAFLAPWRLLYAGYASISNRNIVGVRDAADEEQRAANGLAEYKLWAGIDHFHGRLAEVGPGSTLGIAPLLLLDGCTYVDQIERFAYAANGHQQSGVALHRVPAEKFFLERRNYDFIISNAVMEHLYDPLGTIAAMASALNPGGMMIHSIDCRDHGQFSESLHDLSFLKIPPVLYKPLTLASGLNRVRLSAYLSTLGPLGLKCRILVRFLSGVAEEIVPAREFEQLDRRLIEQSQFNLDSIRSKLSAPFSGMPDRDLMISHFVLVANR